VIFPIFANAVRPEHSKMAAHGFARTTKWEYEKEVIDNEAGVSVRFSK
jgi:glucose-6-phosphate 1-epimerase